VRKRKSCMSYAEPGGNLGCAAMKANAGPTAGFADHLDFQPIHAAADSGAESLSTGFFGGKSSREAFRRVALAQGIGLLPGRENTIEKTLSEALDRLLNACYLNQINSAADDHSEYQANTCRSRAPSEDLLAQRLLNLCTFLPISRE